MPELPDVAVYVECMRARLIGVAPERIRLKSPFLLRTVDPPLATAEGRCVVAIDRIGKRIVLSHAGDLHLVIHLMIAGRLHWRPPRAPLHSKLGLLAVDFPEGSLQLTEAGSHKRASLHVVQGADALRALDPGGADVDRLTPEEFGRRLAEGGNRTLKHALTDPKRFSGIGNAYSDEILHHARLSPLRRTDQLDAEEVARLQASALQVLQHWTGRLRDEAGGGWPRKVTAFREGMAVHGRFRKPCPDCGAPVQRIVRGEHETNYCARCQTGGRVLRDRALSRLLKDDWPREIEE